MENLYITDYSGSKIALRARVELYSVTDFMGDELPGLAIVLDMVAAPSEEDEQYAILTKSFGEFIGLKNSAYIDVNNCPFAPQLLEQGIAADTGFYKDSGFCRYPLWLFREELLKEIGGENYEKYSQAYDKYMATMCF